MKDIAILGASGSGKTALSLELASKFNFIILSLDSLSIYKYIDIASAKPTINERKDIIHFGIDELYPNEDFNVMSFFKIYEKAKSYAKIHSKNLLIVGGSSFYLKSLISSFSKLPKISDETKKQVNLMLLNKQNAYELIQSIDKNYADKISSNDTYRIEKWLEIYLQTNQIPSVYQKQNLNEPIIKDILIYEILLEKEELFKNIQKRTTNMLKQNLIDEVVELEFKYTRSPKCFNSIGIKEVFSFLDAKISKNQISPLITTHTMQLAKRQKTFNQTFNSHLLPSDEIYKNIKNKL